VRQILTALLVVHPRNYELADQLRRASISVTANLAEGYGRRQPKEKRQFYQTSIGSAEECISLLEAATIQYLFTQKDAAHLSRQLNRCILLLVGLVNSMNRRLSRH
jgi:four helix bundle protein